MEQGITLTRCRQYNKNDQAHVEQKNWTAVRRLVGYKRYDTKEERKLLAAIYADGELVVNFFPPIQKLVQKEREGSKVRKVYDQAQTPFQRVRACPQVEKTVQEGLQDVFAKLGLVALRQRIDHNFKEALWVTAIPRQRSKLR